MAPRGGVSIRGEIERSGLGGKDLFVSRELDGQAWGQGFYAHLREGETRSLQEAAENDSMGQSPENDSMGQSPGVPARALRPPQSHTPCWPRLTVF